MHATFLTSCSMISHLNKLHVSDNARMKPLRPAFLCSQIRRETQFFVKNLICESACSTEDDLSWVQEWPDLEMFDWVLINDFL